MDRIGHASKDFRYLLDRGYARHTALNFVCGHYRLGKSERNSIVRKVYSKKEIENHKRRLIPISAIKGKTMVIDGYNVLIGAECVMGRGQIIKSQDGFHRDSLGLFGRYKTSEFTERAIGRILSVLRRCKPGRVIFFFDAQVSKSGQLASYVRKEMREFGLEGDVKTARNVDYEIKSLNEITATSDTAIIEKVDRGVDLIGALRS